MVRRIVLIILAAGCLASSAAAQSKARTSTKTPKAVAADATEQAPPSPPPAPAPPRAPGAPPPPPPPPSWRRGQAVNIKVEVVITDQRGSAAPIKKTISVIVGDQQNGMIRSEALIPSTGSVPLHVDAEPEILQDGKIRLRFGLNY